MRFPHPRRFSRADGSSRRPGSRTCGRAPPASSRVIDASNTRNLEEAGAPGRAQCASHPGIRKGRRAWRTRDGATATAALRAGDRPDAMRECGPRPGAAAALERGGSRGLISFDCFQTLPAKRPDEAAGSGPSRVRENLDNFQQLAPVVPRARVLFRPSSALHRQFPWKSARVSTKSARRSKRLPARGRPFSADFARAG